MPAPANAKKPQDRKKKGEDEKVRPDCFSFEHDGETYTLRPTHEVLTPGFMRKHRNDDEMNQFFTLVEELADEETLDVIDNMGQAEFRVLYSDFIEYMGMTPGE